MLKIVADDKIPFLNGVLEPYAEISYLPGGSIRRSDLIGADALLVRTRTKCDESLLRNTTVKFIGTATIGFDHIDTRYCDEQKIAWTNAPGCNSSSVQQYITAALLKLADYHKLILQNLTIGIVGVGNVGSRVKESARALGMNVLLNDPPRERLEGSSGFVTFDTILQQSDIISLHVPLSYTGQDKTSHLFNDNIINKIRDNAWLINSSRGEVVETFALNRALKEGKISGAIIDVWENEPDINYELLANAFIATPHIAGYSTDGKANGTAMIVNALSRHFRLPLDSWYPENLPRPEIPFINIDVTGKSDFEIVSEAVNLTYDIAFDELNLRESPSSFEKLRGDYRVRREFAAYSVRLKGGNAGVRKILAAIGFKVEQ